MLAKLEAAYLGILRVVILIVATLALAAAALGIATAVPSLMAAGGLGAEEPTGGSLKEWMDEQKAKGISSDQGSNPATQEDEGAAEPAVLPDIAAAAQAIESYLGKDNVNRLIVAERLQSIADDIGRTMADGDAKYAESVKKLTDELLASKGRKLSVDRVGQLLEWHHEHFAANIAAEQARQAEARTGLMMQLGLAGAAFVSFVLIIFVFLFVKIERNLRPHARSGQQNEAGADVA